jgi:hypothetical protein
LSLYLSATEPLSRPLRPFQHLRQSQSSRLCGSNAARARSEVCVQTKNI